MDRVQAIATHFSRPQVRVEHDIREDKKIPDIQRVAIILARVGHGKFCANVQGVGRACRVTKVERPEHLVACHTKPWRDSTNEERLNGDNGLLLTPTIDHLFDKELNRLPICTISRASNGAAEMPHVCHRPEQSAILRRSEGGPWTCAYPGC